MIKIENKQSLFIVASIICLVVINAYLHISRAQMEQQMQQQVEWMALENHISVLPQKKSIENELLFTLFSQDFLIATEVEQLLKISLDGAPNQFQLKANMSTETIQCLLQYMMDHWQDYSIIEYHMSEGTGENENRMWNFTIQFGIIS